MIARVTLEIALQKEFDYLIPEELEKSVEVGTRVKVPFGPRKVLGYVTGILSESEVPNLKPIISTVGSTSLVTPAVLKLARWIAGYYCCPVEIALKSVLPEAVRKEEAGWRERLFVHLLPLTGELPKLTKRQQELYAIVEEWRELPLQELLKLASTTASTVRKLEDKGLVSIGLKISERDPYAKEHLLPTGPLKLNETQTLALKKITEAFDAMGGTRVSRAVPGVPPETPGRSSTPNAITEPVARQRRLPHFEIPGKTYHVTWQTQGNLRLSEKARSAALDACRYWHGQKIKCYIACVLPDHVHLLIQPLPVQKPDAKGVYSLSEILHSIKSFSAHEINKVMDRKGAVWQDESFDRMVRSESDFHEKWNYIWNNPRDLELVGPMEDYDYLWFPGIEESVGDKVSVRSSRRDAGNDLRNAGATRSVADIRHHSNAFLLHGVTGSGKTEIYLQAIAHALEQGKGAIVLVPEISLTPQTVERFKARFNHGSLQTLVAVLHSHLSAGERHDEWHKIREGRAKIVIGARSAIFAPVDPLGLIIVDEEHEHSYKQEEAPRYHARDVAVLRGQMENAVVVLGSATPSMESFYNAKHGKYQLLEMPGRIDDRKMPIVRVVDMRMEARKTKSSPIFSQDLKDAITLRLEAKEQTMLFLNRRGYSTSLQCPQCGYVAGCPNCSVSLTFHRSIQKLCCHICGHEEQAPVVCPEPKCKNPAIRYSGLGTQKVEETLGKLFPHARIQRMDSDALKRKEDYKRILSEFRLGKIDILIGTQMIAKGLHFPNVTLVGIVYADLGLHVPDFRAGERTFQLLTQVAGRAGRGDVEGEVFVQAFTPFHPAIQYARRHDYEGFYEQEIEFREQLHYPPASRIALLTLKGRSEEKVKFYSDHLKTELEKHLGVFKDLRLMGPTPAPLQRAETFYRFQIMVRAKNMSGLSQRLAQIRDTYPLPKEVMLTVDIDPTNLV